MERGGVSQCPEDPAELAAGPVREQIHITIDGA